jgi:hypothetical protein
MYVICQNGIQYKSIITPRCIKVNIITAIIPSKKDIAGGEKIKKEKRKNFA